MPGMMIETVIITFVFGGILGAIAALHLASPKKSTVETKSPQNNRQ